jgi:hypothetical protein
VPILTGAFPLDSPKIAIKGVLEARSGFSESKRVARFGESMPIREGAHLKMKLFRQEAQLADETHAAQPNSNTADNMRHVRRRILIAGRARERGSPEWRLNPSGDLISGRVCFLIQPTVIHVLLVGPTHNL